MLHSASRHILSLLLITASSALAMAQAVWLNQTHDFGAFDESDGTVWCKFRFVNTGSEPIAIVNARANCGCTRPEYSRQPVAPGDTAVIEVGFDPKNRPGRFTKYINVDLSGTPARTSLSIKGTVIGSHETLRSRYPLEVGPMNLRGNMIAFGEISKGHTTGRYLEGYNSSSDTIRPVVSNLPEHINVIVEPPAVSPGDRFVISAIFHSDKTPLWGLNVDSITVAPSAGAAEKVDVETIAIVTEDFSKLTPKDRENAPVIDTDVTAVDLQRISPKDPVIHRTFSIVNKGKSPLNIRRIYSPDRSVDVRMKNTRIKPGKSEKVDLTIDPSLIGDTELLNARITIISNDPVHPTTIVRAVGEVR